MEFSFDTPLYYKDENGNFQIATTDVLAKMVGLGNVPKEDRMETILDKMKEEQEKMAMSKSFDDFMKGFSIDNENDNDNEDDNDDDENFSEEGEEKAMIDKMLFSLFDKIAEPRSKSIAQTTSNDIFSWCVDTIYIPELDVCETAIATIYHDFVPVFRGKANKEEAINIHNVYVASMRSRTPKKFLNCISKEELVLDWDKMGE